MVSNLNVSRFSSKYSSTITLIFPEHRLLVMFSCHPQSRRAFSASLPVTPGCDVHVPWPLAAVCACLTPLRHPQIISPNSTFLPSPFSRSHFHPPSPPSSPSRKVWPAPPCGPKSTRDSASRPGSLRVEQLLPPLDSTRRSTTSAGPDADGTRTPSGE